VTPPRPGRYVAGPGTLVRHSIVHWLREGEVPRVIGKRFGLSERRIQYIAAEERIPLSRRYAVTPAKRELIRFLAAEGRHSKRRIAAIVGHDQRTVRRIVPSGGCEES
jgi:hypothetical protein